MYTVVLLTALTAGENVAEFGRGGCYGGCLGGCYGGYGSCYGCGGGYGMAYYGGGCRGCYGGCYGGGWGKCHGGAGYGACYGGCYGVGYTCGGGCWGASYGCYGAGCHGGMAGYGCGGGCGGYLGAAYGVPQVGIGVPTGKPADAGTMGETTLGNRARVVFTLPEGAKLFIDGAPIEITANKGFNTPELKPGTRYYYDARIEVASDGKKMSGTRRIYVTAGQTVEEDLTTVELKPDLLVTTG